MPGHETFIRRADRARPKSGTLTTPSADLGQASRHRGNYPNEQGIVNQSCRGIPRDGLSKEDRHSTRRLEGRPRKVGRCSSQQVEKPSAGKRELVITFTDHQAMLDGTRCEEIRDLLNTCWEIGCRPQEVMRVEARHVDLGRRRWVFAKKEAKGKKRICIVYLSEIAFEITKRLVENTSKGGCSVTPTANSKNVQKSAASAPAVASARREFHMRDFSTFWRSSWSK